MGAIDGREARELNLIEVMNYSFEGNMTIFDRKNTIILFDVPLLEAFHAIRRILKLMPVFVSKIPYAQMFRDARTVFSMEDEALRIEHREISPLQDLSGSGPLIGSYVQFSREFGAMTRKFVGELEAIAPSLFADERVSNQLSDLFICTKIVDNDATLYSIV